MAKEIIDMRNLLGSIYTTENGKITFPANLPEKKEQLKNARPFTCSKEEGESRVLELEDLVLLQYTSVENVSVYSDQKFKIPKVIVLPVKTILSLGEKDEAA